MAVVPSSLEEEEAEEALEVEVSVEAASVEVLAPEEEPEVGFRPLQPPLKGGELP